jgi:hypothetical protein
MELQGQRGNGQSSGPSGSAVKDWQRGLLEASKQDQFRIGQ